MEVDRSHDKVELLSCLRPTKLPSLKITWTPKGTPGCWNYLVAHPTNRKWVITPVRNGISRVNPLISGVITHLLSGMSHQVAIMRTSPKLGNHPTANRELGGSSIVPIVPQDRQFNRAHHGASESLRHSCRTERVVQKWDIPWKITSTSLLDGEHILRGLVCSRGTYGKTSIPGFACHVQDVQDGPNYSDLII